MNRFRVWPLINSSYINPAIAFGKLNEHVQDCPTWILVEKQRKTPYPPPPTFFLYTVPRTSLQLVLQSVLWEPILQSTCWIQHIERAVEEVVVTSGACYALFCSILSMINKGGKVLIPDPSWPQRARWFNIMWGSRTTRESTRFINFHTKSFQRLQVNASKSLQVNSLDSSQICEKMVGRWDLNPALSGDVSRTIPFFSSIRESASLSHKDYEKHPNSHEHYPRNQQPYPLSNLKKT